MRAGATRRDLLALLGAAALAGAASARPLDDVVQSGVLRVALYRENAPFSDNSDKGPVGIDVDLAKRIAAEIGVKAEIRIVEASENVDGDFRLNLWRGDLAGTGLADLMLSVPADKKLEIRNEQVFFTPPYARQQLSIAYRKGTVEGGFQDLQDIEGRTIALEGTSPADALIALANGGVFRDSAKHFRTFDEAAEDFVAGRSDFLGGSRSAIENAVWKAMAVDVEIKDLAGTGLIRPQWELCGAVRSDSRDLGYRVGEAIAAIAARGETKAIFAAHGASFAPPSGY